MRELKGIDDILSELAAIQNELRRTGDNALLSLRLEKIAESLAILGENFNAAIKHENAVESFLKSTR